MPINDSAPNERHRRRVFVAGAILGGLLIAFLGGRASAPEAVIPPQVEPRPSIPTGPASPTGNVGSGSQPTKVGAVMEATRFARAMGSVTAGDEDYVHAMEAIAAPSWRSEARRLAMNGLEFVRDRYGAQGSTNFVPVRYRVAEFTGGRATVHVWGVILSEDSAAGITNTWGVGTIDLIYLRREWRMSGGESSPGPTPRVLESTDSAPVSVLDGFSEYRFGPQP